MVKMKIFVLPVYRVLLKFVMLATQKASIAR